jgi:hypothetical protein
MKKTLLLCTFIFSTLFFSAQIVQLDGEVNLVSGTAANTTEILDAQWDVINISGTQRDLSCRRRVIQSVPGTLHQFCWGTSCGPWGTDDVTIPEIVTLSDGDTTNSFHCKYQHNGNAGQSIVQYCWFDAGDFGSDLCYNVNFCVDGECIVGVEETPSAHFTAITPNPVHSLSAFEYSLTSKPSDAAICIYDQMGKLVKRTSIQTKNGLILLDAQEFENGIYFCQLVDAGRIVQVQRMVVSK